MNPEATRDLRAEKRSWRRDRASAKAARTEAAWLRWSSRPLELAFKGLELMIGVLPEDSALEIGSALGQLFYCLHHGRRRLALQNLALAFGAERSRREQREIARASFANVGRMAIEFLRFRRLNRFKLRRSLTLHGSETVAQLYAEGRGTLALSAHLGNFELLAASFNLLEIGKNNLLGRRIKPAVMNRIVTGLRGSCGVDTIPGKDSIREILRRLKRNEGVGVVLDQNMRSGVGVFVNYFGVAASTSPGLAFIALRRNVPVQPIFIVRRGASTRHAVLALPRVPLVESGDRERDVLVNTQRFTLVIEALVRRFPEQWFWFHQRWRCRPAGEVGAPGAAPGLPSDPEFRAEIEAQLDEYCARLQLTTKRA